MEMNNTVSKNLKENINGAANAAGAFADKAKSAAESTADKAKSALDSGSSKVQSAQSKVGSFVDEELGQIKSAYSDIRGRAEEALDASTGLLKQYPVSTLLTATAVGFLAGWMLKKKSSLRH